MAICHRQSGYSFSIITASGRAKPRVLRRAAQAPQLCKPSAEAQGCAAPGAAGKVPISTGGGKAGARFGLSCKGVEAAFFGAAGAFFCAGAAAGLGAGDTWLFEPEDRGLGGVLGGGLGGVLGG